MKKVSVVGHFADGLEYLDGQTVKTKILTKELCERFGADQVIRFDTHGGIRTLIKAPLFVFKALRESWNVVILPAHNGLRVFGRLLPFFRRFFPNRKIHYAVIGGWLPKVTEAQKGLANALRSFDGIYVETNTMKRALKAQGFVNLFEMPNCKELEPLSASDLPHFFTEPFKLCTFSRVMKEKGIEDAVWAVRSINEQSGRTIYTLDIFGQVDPAQTEWFDRIKADFPEYVTYGGLVPFDQSVAVLKNYFALLFPTRFYTEGIPGTIIDAYAAGVPVISSRWQSFEDMIEEGVTGVGYDFGSAEALRKVLTEIAQKSEEFCQMKASCLGKSREYLPAEAVQLLISNFK